MSVDTPEKDSFLRELYRASAGELEAHISMYQIGDTLGISRSKISALSEDLIVDGYVELQTLSGAVSLTADGLAVMGLTADTSKSPDLPRLSGEETLTDSDRHLLSDIVRRVQHCPLTTETTLSQLEDILIDLKTLEVQLLATQPKTAIIVAVLGSLAERFRTPELGVPHSDLVAELESLIRLERNSSVAG